MKWLPRLAYGCGQLLKDVVASVLSAFVIVYFQNCLGIMSADVGSLLLAGQVVNAISTPMIGFLSDRAVQHHAAAGNVDQSAQSPGSRPLMRLKLVLKNHLSLHKRKSWHLWGSLLMGVSFPTLFSLPAGINVLPTWSKLMTVGVLLIAIQIGWASVQIAHLTLLNYLTSDPNERVMLVSLRYSFGSIAEISTFTLSYVLLQQGLNSPASSTDVKAGNNIEVGNLSVASPVGNGSSLNESQLDSNRITPDDMPLFRSISLVLTVIGMLAVVIFQCLVPEGQVETQEDKKNQNNESVPEAIPDVTRSHVHFIKSLDELHSISSQLHHLGQSRVAIQSCDAVDADPGEEEPVKPAIVGVKFYAWFRIPRFWLCCTMFTSLRVAASLSLLYLSPFLLENLKLRKSNIVLIPLIAQCTNFVTTAAQHLTTKLFGRTVNALIGIALFLGYCGTIYFCEVGSKVLVYLAAVLLGAGSAFSNVTAIMVISDLIGSSQVQTAAFVNGFASLTEKLVTGVTLQLIQLSLKTLTYRQIEVYIVGGCLILTGILFILDYLLHGGQQTDASSERPSRSRRSTICQLEDGTHATSLMNGEAHAKKAGIASSKDPVGV